MRLRVIICSLFGISFGVAGKAQTPGDEIWRFTAGDVIISSPAVASDGTIYVGAQDNNLYAVNPDGTQKWVFTGATDWIDSSPAVGADGTVYVGSWDNKLYALDAADGSEVWSFETGSLIVSSPAVALDGTIYFGSSDGIFYALNADGTLKWQYVTGDELDSSPAVGDDGTIYFGSYEDKLIALNPDSSLKWEFEVEMVEGEDGRVVSSPAVDGDGNIYFGSGNTNLYALDPNGMEIWSFTTDGKVDSSPAIGLDGTIYFASREGYLYSVDEGGIENWSILVGDVFLSSPAVDSAGNVYIAAFAGNGMSKVFAFDQDAVFLWEFVVSALVDSSPAIGSNGVLYIGAYDNNLYALQAGNPLANSFWPQFSHDPKHTGSVEGGDPPTIVQSPSSATVDAGESVTFSVVAAGTEPLSYQWRKDGQILSGEDGTDLTLDNVAEQDEGDYDVVVANVLGQEVSAAATLSVNSGGGKQNQTITFDPIPNQTYGMDGVALSATATSGLTVSFSVISGPSVPNSDNTLTMTGVGTVMVRASQAGDDNFNPAPDVDENFAISAAGSGAAALLTGGNAKLVNEGTFFDGNTYNGFEIAGPTGTFSSIAGEITRISFLESEGDLMFAEFGSENTDTVLIITLDGFVAAVPSPYNQGDLTYAQGHPSFEIRNSTALTFVSFFSLGNDILRVDVSLINENTFSGSVNGIAEINSLTISDGATAIGGISAANANFVGSDGIIGIDAPDLQVGVFVFVGDLTPSGTVLPVLRINTNSMIGGILIAGGDLAEATGAFQIDSAGIVYPFPITATEGQRSISNSSFRPDLGDGFLPPVTTTFVSDIDAYFLTDGQSTGTSGE